MGAQAILNLAPFNVRALSVAAFNAVVDTKDVTGLSIQTITAGQPTGTYAFAKSNSPTCDPANGQTAAAASGDWKTFAPSGAPANPGGAGANDVFEIDPFDTRFIKVSLTVSAVGTGATYSLFVFGKGRG